MYYPAWSGYPLQSLTEASGDFRYYPYPIQYRGKNFTTNEVLKEWTQHVLFQQNNFILVPQKISIMINKNFFFDQVRLRLFNGKISTRQFEGLNTILNEWEKNYPNADDRFLAYMFATAHHETDRQMVPIEEYGKGKNKDYGRKLKMGNGPGKRVAYTKPDKLYYGRGFVQLTWYENYEKAAKKIGVDCLNFPEKVLEMGPATKIMFVGMMEGWFTGKKLSDYFNSTKEDWLNARRIINGTDKAQLIKDYALKYYSAISYTIS